VPDFAELIQRATTADDPEPAIEELVHGGPRALQEVLAAAATSYQPALGEVIRRSTYPEAIPVLIASNGGPNYERTESIFRALGTASARGDARASAYVLERLSDRSELSTTRAVAAEALDGSTNPTAGPALRAVLDELREHPEDTPGPFLLVAAATALATMNDHSGATALYTLWGSEYSTARAMGARALRIVIDGDAFERLTRAAADPDAEVRRAVVDPVFLLGAPASARLLLRLAEDDQDHEVRYNSTIRFGHILGLVLSGPGDLDFAREQWEEARAGLDEGTCYRFGDPIDLKELVAEFVEEEPMRPQVGEELRILTGIDAPAIQRTEGVEGVQHAMADVAFTVGRVHKWGYPQPMPRMTS
jgi:hypothetical protein